MGKNIILGCDRNNPSEDKKTQEYIGKKLEEVGFTVEIIPVGPNYCQQWGRKSSSNGTTCVMLINGVGQVTAGDFSESIASGFYKFDRIIFAGQGWLWHTQTYDVFKKVTNEHDWNGSGSFKSKYSSKTFDQICKESNGRCDWCCDKTKEGLAKKIIAKLNGKSTDDGDGGGSASTFF
ncbi:MAG: hypothetical protein Q4P18_07770 [Methanobrevibacter sp.]|uniref:hypothetical protein n=1 Tax=Methanobrevibacter sp. TaxID=66852 RepID=UPI0026E07170|nr:hypothetical protein [Methanobrevibacter sp.]MDO5849417.1 hypothetical protein [Methanobrevibacter sp.]